MHACNGILFNHESPRRGYEFVTRKISLGIARIVAGKSKELHLGNLHAKRDWGHAREYVDAMWRMLQQPEPDDYVVATGETNSVQDFVEQAFQCVGLDWRKYVTTDDRLFRPAEVELLIGNAAKAKEILGWQSTVKLPELIREMVESDCAAVGFAGAVKG
jgi:GDPmannose 4,6-dehydratase